jgi:IclR family pca regulon transcriptional regulator
MTSSEQTGGRNGDRLQSLTRGLVILRNFSRQHGSMSVTEVAERANVSRATARRVLLTLEDLGYVQNEYQRYSLRPRVLELAYAYLSSHYPWDSALPVMQAFSAAVDENCLAGVLDDFEVVCVARTTRRSVPVSVPVGGRIPAYASSMGRVLLADLDAATLGEYLAGLEMRAFTAHTITDPDELREELARVRTQGWSLVEHELEPDVIGIAAPIFGGGGKVVGALNVSAHEHRIGTEAIVNEIRPVLVEYSRELSLLFGGDPAR